MPTKEAPTHRLEETLLGLPLQNIEVLPLTSVVECYYQPYCLIWQYKLFIPGKATLQDNACAQRLDLIATKTISQRSDFRT